MRKAGKVFPSPHAPTRSPTGDCRQERNGPGPRQGTEQRGGHVADPLADHCRRGLQNVGVLLQTDDKGGHRQGDRRFGPRYLNGGTAEQGRKKPRKYRCMDSDHGGIGRESRAQRGERQDTVADRHRQGDGRSRQGTGDIALISMQ